VAKTSPPAEAGYQLTEQIPSVFLEKDTVNLIEAFLLERGAQVDPPRAKGDVLFLSIIDTSGASRLSSIKDYPFSTFDEGLRRLFVSYGVFGEALSISVNFSKKGTESHVSVNYRGAGARQVVEGIAGGVLGILEDVETSNALYHPSPALRGALTALLFLGIGFQLGFLLVYGRVLPFLFPLDLLLFTYLYVAPRFNPYTTFDTPRNRKSRYWSAWLVGAALTLQVLWLANSLFGSLLP
jgi:hypothetical protein